MQSDTSLLSLYIMLLFCPVCGNMLFVGVGDEGLQKFKCQSCPYVYPVVSKIGSRIEFNAKKVDDVLGGSDEWKNVDQTDATCPKCENGSAYFIQIQIRSADEPMTIFYKCINAKCSHQWREG